MSDFDKRRNSIRSSVEPGDSLFGTGPGFVAAAAILAIVGYFGAAAATGRLDTPAWLKQMVSEFVEPGPKVDDALIGRRLAVCAPRPSDPRQRERSRAESRGVVWRVDEADPESWLPPKEVPRFLNCAATFERKRFCKSSWRKRYASQISRYYRLLSEMGMDTPAMTRFLEATEALEEFEQGNKDALKNRITTPWASPSNIATGGVNSVIYNPVILSAVQSLSHDGLLNWKDFGWSGPPEPIKTVLEKEPRGTGKFCL